MIGGRGGSSVVGSGFSSWCGVARTVAFGSAMIMIAAAIPSATAAQELTDFDYENLSFRGIGFDVGYIMPNRVDATPVFGGRVDLGYLGPGFRVVPHFSYWSSSFKRAEVQGFENQLESLIARESGQTVDVELGAIDWSDLSLGVDGQFVWAIPRAGLLSYAGVGMTAHKLNGEGQAIRDTFIEDLLDAISAGFNAHLGIEVPWTDQLRFYGQAKYEMMSDLRYFEIRLGGQIMFAPSLPDERPR